MDKTLFRGPVVGDLSGLAVDTDGTVAALSDRSQLFALKVGRGPAAAPVRVVPLADEKGAPLDSEAVVIDRGGTRLITSEVEPSVRRYDLDGKLLGRLPVPGALRVAPAGRATVNLTFEGLALQPGGHTLIASMEGPCRATARTLPDIHSYGSRPGTAAARKVTSGSPGSTPGATAEQPQPNPLLDDIEGTAVTGRTRDGRLRLLLVSDDNENPKQIARPYSLTIRPTRRV
ncbi:esterase-like activity of phytase family protein [Streptomyces sp. NPDC050485]|uniref:esterase-like activity of phytase family protein n=1 Tax=Streptomyces sp. NPDC050485 TaxID=3365617 RepID=UPI0037B7602D